MKLLSDARARFVSILRFGLLALDLLRQFWGKACSVQIVHRSEMHIGLDCQTF